MQLPALPGLPLESAIVQQASVGDARNVHGIRLALAQDLGGQRLATLSRGCSRRGKSSSKQLRRMRLKSLAGGSESSDTDKSDDRPKLGACELNPAEVAGKGLFEVEKGDLMTLKFKGNSNQTEFDQFIDKIFKCTVVKFEVQKTKRDKRGVIVEQGGEVVMVVKWEDAPAAYKVKVKGKMTGIVGMEHTFGLEDLKDFYTVVKRSHPVNMKA